MQWLARIVSLWETQIENCQKVKKAQFGATADLVWGFMGTSYRDLNIEAEGVGEEMPDNLGNNVRTRINKTREFVSLMLPRVHESVINRVVLPRRDQLDPVLLNYASQFNPNYAAQQMSNDKLRTAMMQYVLNYLPSEYDSRRETRTATIEALSKGRGVVWHEMTPGAFGYIPASFYDTVDNLLIDPDCRQFRDAGYIIRRREQSVQRAARRFGLDPDTLRGAYSSTLETASTTARQNTTDGAADADKDIIVYYEIFSRIGFGQRMRDTKDLLNILAILDSLGENIYLAVVPGMKYPLNLQPDFLETASQEEVQRACEWPVAFYDDPSNPWPCSFLDFLPNADNPWATSPLEAALPLQVFLDRVYAFLMSRVKATCRDLIFVDKALAAAVAEALVSSKDQEVIPCDDVEKIKELVYLLQFQPVNPELWQILTAVERKFEQLTGMDPLLYGSSPSDKQMRSAYESRLRETSVNSRPDDYADTVMAWLSAIASKEAQMCRMYLLPETVAPIFGEQQPDMASPVTAYISPLTWAWSALVTTDDPATAAAEFDYTCEAGVGSRKNRQKLISDAQMLIQNILPTYLAMAAQGNVEPYNQLLNVLADAFEIAQLNKLAIPAPMMNPQMALSAATNSPQFAITS